jgi:hypothetical protein
MKKIGDYQAVLLPATYFGPIHYFAVIKQARAFIIESEEHYMKQTWRNRCAVLTANGVLSLTIPVIKVDGNHTKIKDVLVSYREKWQLIHWRTIASAYRNTPFFLYYADELESILFSNEERLFDFNFRLTTNLLKMLHISTQISFTGKYEALPAADTLDLRGEFTPKNKSLPHFPVYMQPFSERHGFVPGLSIIDLLFNLGPDAGDYLKRLCTL